MNILDVSTGVDIESVLRFDKYSKNTNSAFLRRVYTKKEIDYCFKFKNIAEHLAVRFCAKEATYKALSHFSIKNIKLSDIEITNNTNGVPEVSVKGQQNFIYRVSLSHGNDMAIASVVVIKTDCCKEK
jgi:holo-[acyl-carrier protein] synthase